MAVPGTVALGAKRIDGPGSDKIEWKPAKPMVMALHFANEAAKRKAMENERAAKPDAEVRGPSIAYADPHGIRRVPVYRGLAARIVNNMRCDVRRGYRFTPDGYHEQVGSRA